MTGWHYLLLASLAAGLPVLTYWFIKRRLKHGTTPKHDEDSLAARSSMKHETDSTKSYNRSGSAPSALSQKTSLPDSSHIVLTGLLTAAERDLITHWNALARTAEHFLLHGGHRGIRWQIIAWQSPLVLATTPSTTGVWGLAGIELLPDLSSNEKLLDAPGAEQIKQASLLFHYAAIDPSAPLEIQFHQDVTQPDRAATDARTITQSSSSGDQPVDPSVASRVTDTCHASTELSYLTTEPFRWRFACRLLMNLSPDQAVERLDYRFQSKIQRPNH